MSIRMVGIGRLPRGVNADHADDVRGGVGQGMKAVGKHAHGSAGIPEGNLAERHHEIEDENAQEYSGDAGVPARTGV
jgi:hypothetical protein